MTSSSASCSGTSSQWRSHARGPRPLRRDVYRNVSREMRFSASAFGTRKQPSISNSGSSSGARSSRKSSRDTTLLVLPADGRPRRDPPGLQVGRDDHDVLEAEGVAHADAHVLHDRVRARVRGQARRHPEQLLEREAVACGLGRLLRRLHGDCGVVGECHENVELLVGRTQAAHRLVDGEDADEVAVVMAHRHEERVERMPRVVADARRAIRKIEVPAVFRPVELAGRDEVRAALAETVGEQRLPVLDPAHEPDEDGLGLGAAVHRRALEVVPLRAVEVDRDGLVAERLGDDARDRTEEAREVVGGANEPGDLEEATKRRDRGSSAATTAGPSRTHRHGTGLHVPPSE